MNEEVPLFRFAQTFQVKYNPEGLYTLHGADGSTSEVASLDAYEPMNDAAYDMKQASLTAQGFQPMPEEGAPQVNGALLAHGRFPHRVLQDALLALATRYGMSITVTQSAPMCRRQSFNKTEYRGRLGHTRVYLEEGPDSLALPIKREDVPLIREALASLRAAGGCDTGRVDALLEALRGS